LLLSTANKGIDNNKIALNLELKRKMAKKKLLLAIINYLSRLTVLVNIACTTLLT